jgi:VWFA-related protein
VYAAMLLLPLGAQDTAFRSQSRVVLVPVTVTDHKGRSVDGLRAGDFELLDDGVPRQVASMDTLGTGVAPISLVVAVQSAGISAPALAKIRHIGGMIVPLITGERGLASVMAFDEGVHLLQDFTSDTAAVEEAFHSIRPGGDMRARMLDAALEGVHRLGTRPGRRVLVLISEKRDRGSSAKLADVIREAERLDVSIYAASYSVYATTFVSKPEDVPPADNTNFLAVFTELARLAKTNTVQALTAATGGAMSSFTRERALEHIVEHLGAELHSQYILGFIPEDAGAGFHRLEVRLRAPGDFHVRARPGYQFTPGQPAGATPAVRDESLRPHRE